MQICRLAPQTTDPHQLIFLCEFFLEEMGSSIAACGRRSSRPRTACRLVCTAGLCTSIQKCCELWRCLHAPYAQVELTAGFDCVTSVHNEASAACMLVFRRVLSVAQRHRCCQTDLQELGFPSQARQLHLSPFGRHCCSANMGQMLRCRSTGALATAKLSCFRQPETPSESRYALRQ